jgi:hypothetical protein
MPWIAFRNVHGSFVATSRAWRTRGRVLAKLNWYRSNINMRQRRNGIEWASEPKILLAKTPAEKELESKVRANKKSKKRNKSKSKMQYIALKDKDNSRVKSSFVELGRDARPKTSDDGNKTPHGCYEYRKAGDFLDSRLRTAANRHDERVLGRDKTSGGIVLLKLGLNGPYVERGAKRCFLPKEWTPEAMNLEKALRLLSLPRKVGIHPEDSEPIIAGLDRFGPYLKHARTYAVLPDSEDVFEVGLAVAIRLIAQQCARSGS